MASGFSPSDDVATSPHVFGDQSRAFGREHQIHGLHRAVPVDLNMIRQHGHTDLLLAEHTHQIKPGRASIHTFRALEILGQDFGSSASVALFNSFNG